jgi:tight adherence protein B
VTRAAVLLLAGAVGLLWIASARQWVAVLDERRQFLLSADPHHGSGDEGRRGRLENRVRGTTTGRALAELLGRAAVPIRVVDALLVASLAVVATVVVAGLLFNRIVAVAVALAAPFAVRALLRGLIRRRALRVVDQLPDLSGMLAGSSAAGLSVPIALRLAADDLPDPLAGELQAVLLAISVGTSPDDALEELARRMPSREMTLFVTTVVVQTRGGGDMVKALRRLTESLEARRENRREYLSLTAGSTSTAYLMVIFGVGMTALVQHAFPGALDRTLSGGVGRIAVIASVGLYAVGLFLVRRVARRPL